MRTVILKRAWRAFGQAHFIPQSRGVIIMVALLLATANLFASPVVNTLGGGNPHVNPKYLGYEDGITLSQALFHTPYGITVDSTGQYLFVADRDNNLIRFLDLDAGWTWTFDIAATNLIKKPIAVALDSLNNVYVLNRGTTNNISTNGTVVEFDNWGDAVATNAVRLTNAAGMALDKVGNIYVTVQSNKLIRIAAGTTNRTTIATNFPAGTSLQGIVVKQNGLIAACDSGRNGIYLIDPATGIVTTNAGFHGAGDFTTNGNNVASPSNAKFNRPMNVAEIGDGNLIVTDNGNNRVKVVLASGVVTNLYGVTSKYWGGTYPGWYDGTVQVPDSIAPNVQSRLPVGVAFAPDGTVYTTEDYYHTIRKVTGANLPLVPPPPPPPPPPPVPATPIIGVVNFPPPNFWSVLTPVTSWVFNNDVIIAIKGTNGTQTFFTSGITGTVISDPSPTNGGTAPYYADMLYSVTDLPGPRYPDMTIKAVNVNGDGLSSSTTSARFQFVVGNPLIIGNNAALFSLSDITTNAVFWYSFDGVDPTNSPGTTNYDHSFLLGTNSLSLSNQFSLNISSNFTFKVRAFRDNYQPSAVVPQNFSTSNFVPNSISFGFFSGEASSVFVASPGQIFYAPVTLSTLPGTVMYSLQFNLTVNSVGTSTAITPGAFRFASMLMKPDLDNPGLIIPIPPYMFINNAINPPPPGQIIVYEGTNFVNLVTTDLSLNMLGVGWLERLGQTNLFDTKSQNLLTMSMAHDDLFPTPAQPNGVIVGGYAFQVPANAAPGDTYQIQIGRPSATSDGIGAPGHSVFVFAPTNGSLGAGSINAIKNVIVGQRKYIAGDSAPFGWFNAGDFGNTNLDSSDVAQVFEAAVYGLNTPPVGTDLFDSMDSCGYTYVDNGFGYLQPTAILANTALLFNGNDTTIDQIAFGDGNLDVADVYVTYRRSLQTNLVWFRRYWTNDVAHGVSGRVAEIVPNEFNPSVVTKSLSASKSLNLANNSSSYISITNQPKVNFTAGDYQTTAGSTIQIPITANIFGNYPLRMLLLNLTVVPLDGSPALTTPVSFSYNPALGSPWTTEQRGKGNYSAAWLNNNISGLSNNVSLGTLYVTIPANATSSSAYAVHFDHVSASPNGMASFPKQARTGLITLSNRSGSSYNDGIPDAWRLRYFLTLNNLLSQTNADADGDGMNNLQEYLAGTDPTDPTSFFKNIGTDQGAAQQPNDCVISWPSVSGKQYVIERSSSLVSPNWTSIATNSGNGTIMEFHDTAGGGIRFYQVRVQ